MMENMRIKRTSLGYEDHGILTANLHLEGNGTGVTIGGYALDSYNRCKGERVPTAKGFEAVIQIMETVGVRTWEELAGKYIRVQTSGIGGTVTKIGHLIEDRWFDYKEFFKEENQ